MIESKEDITLALSIGGEVLTFPGFTILGVPGSLVYSLRDYSLPNEIDKQDYIFQISHADFLENNISEFDTFNYVVTNSGLSITFKIQSYSVDLQGWCRLNVSPIDYS